MPYARQLVWCCLVLFLAQNGVRGKFRVRKFPDNMKFGAATAAYQIEGAWNKDGKAPSIWDDLVHTNPSAIEDRSNGDIAADSYHLYKKDVDIMKELGLNFYRFSISWPRILPNGFAHQVNEAGVKYYSELIDELIKNKIEPMVTMYHWDLPANLQTLGGWTNPLIATWFANYARVLFDRFGDRVKLWVTINEPKQICYEGYGSDKKAPMLNMTGIAEYMCAKNVLLAHAKAFHIYDDRFRDVQKGKIGISISCTWYEPASDSPEDHQAAEDARQFDWGQYAHPIFSRGGDFPLAVKKNVDAKSAEQNFPESRLPVLTADEVTFIRGTSDFFGINSYTTKLAYRDASLEEMYTVPSYMDDMGAALVKDSVWPQAQSTWLQEVPWGFYKLLSKVHDIYGNPPVYITENGWSTAGGLLDDDRIRYLRGYLNALLDAIEDGSDVLGYTAWSLIDNFEWAQGYTEKFGLYEVNFSSPLKTRTPRKSAYVYKEIIRSRSLDPHYDPESVMVLSRRSPEGEKDENDGY